MTRTCPSCKSHDARRSSVRASEITFRHIFFSPYRCRECRTRFWVLSRNTYYLAGIVGIAIALGAVGWRLGTWFESPRADAGPTEVGASTRIADLMKLAEGNDATAEYELAQMYAIGIGVPKSPTEEHNWLQRSARHGNVQAQYELGISLREGRGTVQDFDEARKWLQRAAEGGNGRAQYALGHMYRTGMGTPIDNVKAYVWLNVAAAQGVSGAGSARDTALGRLSAAELLEAQAEARRMSEIYIPKAAPAK
jgi:TPR repeat protein